jgi:hypothetical protein
MPTTKNGVAKIHRVQGIHLNYQSYWCKEFTDPALAGKKVPVRYNPDNAAYAYAYINGQWIECISEFAAIFKNRSVKQIELITQNLKAKNMLMSKKQKLTAHTIAAFLREASLSEELQRQIWRDQELLARANLESKPMQDVEQESDIYDMDTTNDQDLQVYEDF